MWMVQLIPQIIKSYREKSTDGLSPWLMFIWALSAPFLGVYMIAQDISIPLILQPQLFGAMAALSWTQCLYYSYQKNKIYCSMAYSTFLVVAGAFQGGFAMLARHKYENRDVWTLRTFALISSILLSAGLLPQYWEIWKRKEVVGVSMSFMLIDLLGGVFSALSLVFKETFDIFAAIPYLLVLVLDGLVIVLAIVLNPLAHRRRRRRAFNESIEVQPPTIRENTEAKSEEA
ncbi:unnamed protein product [Rhizoctonia solani]|uniref:Uncharacterized protein n=1 Tax=Rhizoctonia solani TaxID=456999 RepID=A0A8H3AJN4_9AGAM|nr:unnamed protein product [Rhizoctonia solani]